MSLPFELRKYHKHKCKSNWKRDGMKIDPDDFEYIYNEYITATNCDLCNIQFKNSKDRQLDHDHKTGEVRNIVCQKCNLNKEDRVINNNTGEKHISKLTDPRYKLGYRYKFQIYRDGEFIIQNYSVDLDILIKIRDEFLKNNYIYS